MKELPIIFSPMMVRALDRKTQTRRIVKPQPGLNNRITKSGRTINITDPKVSDLCPYGQPGDRLWVRERFRYYYDENNLWDCVQYADGSMMKPDGLDESDGHRFSELCRADSPWRPSIHMPRWASRIVLEITDIRVERLQDISEEDAKAEGVESMSTTQPVWRRYTGPEDGPHYRYVKYSFMSLWESIHGYGSWDANPWVWVVSFRKLDEGLGGSFMEMGT